MNVNKISSMLMLFSSLYTSANAQENNPNIIVVLTDDLGMNDLGIHGNNFIETPNLDRLAKNGVYFTDAYSSAPLCSPARASLLTGLHPVEVNITEHLRGHYVPGPNIPLAPPRIDTHLKLEYRTVGELMKDENYNTAYLGKWHLGGIGASPDLQGFDFTYACENYGLPNTFYYPFFNHGMEDLKADTKEGDYLTFALTDKAIEYIEKRDTFFMILSYFSPHVPVEGPVELVEKYIGKRGGDFGLPNPHYAAMVEAIDINVGRLVNALEEKGILDNTLIVFTSDNGALSVEEVPAFAKHTPPTDNHPFREGKGFLYEGGLRVPLIMHWPDYFNKPGVVDRPVVGTDIFNTLSHLFGREERTPNGVSLFNTIDDKNKNRIIVWHLPHYSPQGGTPVSAIRKANYKLIYYYEDQSYELYNLKRDISESNNLVNRRPRKAKRLLRELEEWKKEFNAQVPAPNPNYKNN